MPHFSRLNHYFNAFLESSRTHGKPLLVACSGGGDSVALANLAGKHHRGNLSLAFVQHGLRGDESSEDESFLKQLAQELSCRHRKPIEVHVLDGRISDKKGQGIESAARIIRRHQLATLAKRTGFNAVLMGHNLNDQAETFIMRLARGAGPMALGGIRPRAYLPDGVLVIRPLLVFERIFLRKYLNAEGLTWRDDSSNQSCRFTRNHVRKNVIEPLLARFGKHVLRRLCSHADWVAQKGRADFVETSETLEQIELERAGPKIILRRSKTNELTVPILADVLHVIWKRENWPAKALTKAHLNRIAEHILHKRSMGTLPGGIRIHLDEHVVSLGPDFIALESGKPITTPNP